MMDAIDVIPYPKGGTKTSIGLNKVREVLFTEEHGMRPAADGVAKVLVVITDGQSNSGFEVGSSSGHRHGVARAAGHMDAVCTQTNRRHDHVLPCPALPCRFKY